jgi:PPOX class probable F420-dependent enzyme
MQLHPALRDAIDAGVHGHLVTLNKDGSPQVTVIWLGRDRDEVIVAHLGDGKKIRNLERDPRVAVSFVAPGSNAVGLEHYAVIHGTARVTQGGGRELLRQLAPRFLGEGAVFPPTPDPPAGRVVHITVERVTGVGPWA